MTQNIYGLTCAAAQTYSGAAATLPGAASMSAGVLVNITGIDVGDLVTFGNFVGGNAGWRIRVLPAAAGTGGNAMSVVIDTDAWTVTVIFGATLGDWMFVAFTLDGATDTVTVYINGEAVFESSDVTAVVTPQAAAPALQSAQDNVIVSAAFYTEQALSAENMAALGIGVKTVPFVSTALLDHIYSAPVSLRPVRTATAVFADIGSVGGVPLTPAVASLGVVRAGDFGQPVVPIVTTGILDAPEGS